jgi:hypothetical protein
LHLSVVGRPVDGAGDEAKMGTSGLLSECYIPVTKQPPHPYLLKIRACNTDVDRYRWEIIDSDGVVGTSWHSFATEQEAEDNGQREMQSLLEMWNKK